MVDEVPDSLEQVPPDVDRLRGGSNNQDKIISAQLEVNERQSGTTTFRIY